MYILARQAVANLFQASSVCFCFCDFQVKNKKGLAPFNYVRYRCDTELRAGEGETGGENCHRSSASALNCCSRDQMSLWYPQQDSA